ncbi:YhgE/Pip domain-containing protein [Lactiplantibacillus plantarum]|uniref:YhgE/Pip domain-containing protein n=1 Tax=Lactiplantibacillus plantarum TaxID=1590 RepID=UPI0006DAE376|nr:YhgE/Pip domain-containing protein [Lactiplantibacillus plantarum]AYF25233.1 YhgE/Pip domain-containing protein [Lactiplantibacillus plantarum]WGI42182.1 YhgE/Pip domain-containing protein [Lactiplantibacillus plantarum]
MKMIRDEWRSIRHSKILWISVSVMILIPFLYSIFFLKSVWDPYGDTQNLPVAVVNEDKSVNYQGEKFAVGKQVVTNLKKNNDLDWHFVSAKKAKQGLKDRKYYTVVTIPSNFSKNATTMTDTNPKKMNLHYETNESLNYIAKVITDTGVSRVNKSIRAQVTKAYALAIFKQIRTAGKGYQKAADGATKLKDGGVELQDGLTTYTTGVHTLKNGTVELKTSVTPLSNGVSKLADGSNKVTNGLGQLNSKTGTLSSGVSQLENGSGQVTNGLVTLDNQIPALSGAVTQLFSGSGQVTSGSSQVTTGLGTLAGNSTKLASGVNQLANGSETLRVGVAQYTGGVYTVTNYLKQLNQGAKQFSGVGELATGADTLQKGISGYTNGVATVNGYASQANTVATELKKSTKDLPTQAAELADGARKIDGAVGQFSTASGSMTSEISEKGQALKDPANQQKIANLQQGMADMKLALQSFQKQLSTQQSQSNNSDIATVVSDMQTNISKISSSTTTNNTDLTAKINSRIKEVQSSNGLTDEQVAALEAKLSDVGATTSTASNESTKTALASDASKLQSMLKSNAAATSQQTDLVTKFSDLQDGVDSLISDLSSMSDSVSELETSSTNFTSELNQLKTKTSKLSAGLTSLNENVPTLVAGINGESQLAAGISGGTNKLIQNNDSLNGGSALINEKLGVISSAVPTLVSSIDQITNGSEQIAAKSGQLNAGASQVADGNAQLNSQIPVLVSGVDALFKGSSQVTSGSSKVTNGLGQLNSKTGELATGVTKLKNGSAQVTNGLSTLNGQIPVLVSAVQQLFSGSRQVTSGLNTLNGQVPALMAGVSQLNDGATQLDNNSAKLLSGTKQIKNGNKTLATSLQEGADQVNATPLKNANAKMMAAPTKTSYKDYTHVPNYVHALAPYVLSLALYVGAIVFNFAYPIRRIADDDGTPTQWFWSKVAVGGPVALAMAVIEATVLLVAGLKPISVPEYYLTAIMIALASMFLVMFLSMLFDNPGRFVAMVILMLQLGGSGGTFPMEITNKFFNAIHPYLPLTYSIQAFRQALTGGWGSGIFWSSIVVLAGITIVSLGLLWASMVFLKQHDMQVPAEAEIQMKAGK